MGRKRSYTCKKCGATMRYVDDNVLMCDNCEEWVEIDFYDYWDPDDYYEIYSDPEEDFPDVCKACGGPYPDCSIGCNLLEQD